LNQKEIKREKDRKNRRKVLKKEPILSLRKND